MTAKKKRVRPRKSKAVETRTSSQLAPQVDTANPLQPPSVVADAGKAADDLLGKVRNMFSSPPSSQPAPPAPAPSASPEESSMDSQTSSVETGKQSTAQLQDT